MSSDMLQLGAQAWLAQMSDDEFTRLVKIVRPPPVHERSGTESERGTT